MFICGLCIGDIPIGPICMWCDIMGIGEGVGVSSKGFEATMVSPRAENKLFVLVFFSSCSGMAYYLVAGALSLEERDLVEASPQHSFFFSF